MSDQTRIAVIGVPSSAGARRIGQDQAPESLRRAGLLQQLRATGHDVVDRGDLTRVSFSPDPENPKCQNVGLVRAVAEEVAIEVHEAIEQREWPLVIGGDCTVTLGAVAALTRHSTSVGLMYFDGDLDLNTPATTESGILDGMVLAHLLGDGAPQLNCWHRHPLLAEENVVLFGYSAQAGGIDAAELVRLPDTRMPRYPFESVADDVRAAATQALAGLESKVEHILVHFDVDVIDAADFPAVDVPHRPGLGLDQAEEALSVFLASPKVAGLVLTEFNARLDPDGRLAERLCSALRNASEKLRAGMS